MKAKVVEVRRATNANGDYLIVNHEEIVDDATKSFAIPRAVIFDYSEELEKKWKKRIGYVNLSARL